MVYVLKKLSVSLTVVIIMEYKPIDKKGRQKEYYPLQITEQWSLLSPEATTVSWPQQYYTLNILHNLHNTLYVFSGVNFKIYQILIKYSNFGIVWVF